MTEKELERQNFLTWCKYATSEEIEKAKRTNKRKMEKLLYKYANEIEKINNSKYVSEYMSQHNIGVQKLELSLEIAK
jgi:RNA polymerase-binding transcription factor DksA